MATRVLLKNPRSGEVQRIKVGWSWTLFFFASTGLPLFIRRLYAWGAVFLALEILYIIIIVFAGETDEAGFYIFLMIMLSWGMHIWIAIKGNEMMGKNFLDMGWVFADEHSWDSQYARKRWGLVPVGRSPEPDPGPTDAGR